MLLKISIRLVIDVEVDVGMRALIMLLKVLLRYEKLGALLAFVKFTALLSRHLEQIFIRRQGLLLQPQFFLKHVVLCLLFPDGIAYLRSLLMRLLVVKVERFRQSLQIVLRINQILDRHLAQSEQFDEMGVAKAF